MRSRFAVIGAVVAIVAAATSAAISPTIAGNIIDEWANAKAPPPPELKPVTIDPKTTALLMLDLFNPNCTRRPRCIASMPTLKKLLTEARAQGVLVIYSVYGKFTAADIMTDIAPVTGEPLVRSNVDKFASTDLDKILKDKAIQSVIVTGTAAHGAVLYTASTAAQKGFHVIIPVDGMSSENLYFEQVSAWLLANGTGGIGPKVTLTRSDMIKF
jgi:nicotinamidase-related amidase